MTRFLKEDTFALIVESTPLVSIDLIVKSPSDKVFLGKRLNRPAQNYWFVPGGRIYKNERLDEAFLRIAKEELGLEIHQTNSQFLGVFEHFYQESRFGLGLKDSSTHYLALGYQINLDDISIVKPTQFQHHEYKWWDLKAMILSDKVHEYTKNYFLF